MESYKTFIKNHRNILLGHILIYAQGIILMPIIIKTVGVTVYGGYILVFTLLGFIYGISSLGAGFKCGRFLPVAEGRQARRALFYPQFCFHFLSIACISLAFMFFYPFLDRFLFKGGHIFSRWIVFPYLFSTFIFSQAATYFLSTHRMSRFNYATVALPYINIAMVALIYFVKRDLSVNILLFTQVLSYTLLAIPLIIMLIREIGVDFALSNLRHITEDIRLGFPLRINYVMDFLLVSSDRYLIMYFMTVAAVGYYSPAYAVGSLIIFFPKVSGVVLLPLLSRAIDNRSETEAHTMLNYAIKGFLLLAIPFIAGTAVMSRPILNLLANAEVSRKACMVTPVVAVATLFFGLNIILSNVLWVRMKTFVILKMNVLGSMINIALNLVFLYIFKNILVAAFTTLMSYTIVFIFIRRAVIKEWPVRFEFAPIVKSIFASLLMGSVLYWISAHLGNNACKIGFVLSGTLIGIVIYIFALLAMRTFSEKELIYIKKVFS